jgi:metal-responsive CopG/Arc/MetJ family transcriptional regulator
MHTQKVAVTIPKDIIIIIDKMSKQEGMSRSKFISRILREKVREKEEKKLTNAFNIVFDDESIRKEQLETAEWFEGSGNNEGQAW